jgi:hypothetical protein
MIIWDMLAYLLAIPAIAALWARPEDADRGRSAAVLLLVLLVVFGVVWGGYAVDSWRYLSNFDKNPFNEHEEWLFWLAGHRLGRLVPDPWPLKLLTGIAIALYGAAVLRDYRGAPQWQPVLALVLVALLPVYFLGFFNVVRQGLAGAVLAFGVTELANRRYGRYSAVAAIAFLLHQTSIIPALVLPLALLLGRYRGLLLLAGPLVGLAVHAGLKLAGIQPEEFVRYSGRHEGIFHYAKFGVAYGLAWLLVVLPAAQTNEVRRVATAYVLMVAAASLLLKYEVAFERLLLYSELLLPFVLPRILAQLGPAWRSAPLTWALASGAGLVLWTNGSILRALGLA